MNYCFWQLMRMKLLSVIGARAACTITDTQTLITAPNVEMPTRARLSAQ